MEEHTGNIQGLAKECAIRMLRTHVSGVLCTLNTYQIRLSKLSLYIDIERIVQEFVNETNVVLVNEISKKERGVLIRELTEYAGDVYNVV